jgi:hypothetical protein
MATEPRKRPLALWVLMFLLLLMIGLGTVMQPLYFGVGLAILLMMLAPSVRAYLLLQEEVP